MNILYGVSTKVCVWNKKFLSAHHMVILEGLVAIH